MGETGTEGCVTEDKFFAHSIIMERVIWGWWFFEDHIFFKVFAVAQQEYLINNRGETMTGWVVHCLL